MICCTQEGGYEKEQRRIEAMRQRNKERTERFMDARGRTLGVDKLDLDKQIKEKELSKIAQKEATAAEGKQKQCKLVIVQAV